LVRGEIICAGQYNSSFLFARWQQQLGGKTFQWQQQLTSCGRSPRGQRRHSRMSTWDKPTDVFIFRSKGQRSGGRMHKARRYLWHR